ncbi:right-handed parallel beta-helix repeat-containing protein [Halorientalis halophila]|uniref:right-handed parallel beta-helix repeat-containing protein n=1 Tax=Halorientalis halophila TaxID=3108499 RepID=UPI0030094024
MTRRRGRLGRAGSLLLTTAVAVLALGTLAAGGATAQTAVEDCREITEPGEYALAGNLSGGGAAACLRIRTSDVVLDGGGDAVVGNGSGTGTVGVLVEPPTDERLQNVTVSNLTTTGWETGITYRGAVASGTVRNVTAENNRDGVVVDPAYEFAPADGTIEIVAVRAVGNERWGVTLRPGADGERLTDIVARNNDAGIVAVDVRNLALSDTRATNNTAGIQLGDATAATLRNATVSDNARTGLWAGNGFDDGRLLDLTATDNGGSGVTLGPASNVTFGNATATDNEGSGLVVRDASSIRVRDLTVTGNRLWGLDFDGVTDARLVNVTADANGAGLYTATGSENITIRSIRGT